MLSRRQQINGQPTPPPLRSARDVREWARRLGVDPALVELDDGGYPYFDGIRTMSQGEEHSAQLEYGGPVLRARYGDRADIYVGWDVYVHTADERGKLLSLAPDFCVAFGVRLRPGAPDNDSYRIGHNGPAPSFVMEVLSKSTRMRDLRVKPGIYAYMEVAEYWIVDPLGKDVPGHVVGHRLRDGAYEPMARPQGGLWHSDVLDLGIRFEAGLLRFRDPATGEDLLSYQEEQDMRVAAQAAHQEEQAMREEEQAMRVAAQAAQQEEQAMRVAAEAEIARLRALLERDRQGHSD